MAKELSWDQAIIKVLEENEGSMHYSKIADEIVSKSYRTKIGATPAQTVNVTLHSDKLSDKVTCVGRGIYILNSIIQGGTPLTSIAGASLDSDDEENDDLIDDALITAYGRFWSRSLWEDNKNRLYGSSSKTANAAGVDFAEFAGIYLLHKGYEVIYVGQATKLIDRLIAHTKDDKRNRLDNFSWFCIEEFEKDSEKDNSQKTLSAEALLDTLEALLIETLGPERNKKVGNSFEDKEFEQNTALDFLNRKR